jgi:membrane associated rhomboid family serine protease
MKFGYSSSSSFPPVVKNLLILNIIMFAGTYLLLNKGVDLYTPLAIHYPGSDLFKPWQVVTHLFMHGSLSHLFFNMFTLWMFGRNLELIWGSKRFFNFYFLTAFGAMILYYLVIFIQIKSIDPAIIQELKDMGGEEYQSLTMIKTYLKGPAELFYGSAVGASGAIMGLLGATYVLFPNSTVYLYFAIPVKMKYFVFGMAALSIYLGIVQYSGDNIAHFAHLGGLLAGILIVKYWNKTNRNSFY